MVEILAAEFLQQPQLRLPGDDRDRLEQPTGGSGQTAGARKHRVSDRLGYLFAARREHFDHEERVTARPAVQLLGVDAVRLGEVCDCRG